jgi:PBP1b-binding outer membrane lipoprotein LpoB
MKKIGILSLLIFFIIFLSSCNNEDQKINKKYYQTTLVQTGNIQNTKSYIGYTDSFHSIALAAKVG